MKVFKFGGASVKDAYGVRNISEILKKTGLQNKLVVISAMGKTTNALELVIKNYLNNKSKLKESLEDLSKYHYTILAELFDNKSHIVYKRVNNLLVQLDAFISSNKSTTYNFVYDQIIGYGEMLSTTIVSSYFNEVGLDNEWLNVCDLIKTDDKYRDARVDWEQTSKKITDKILPNILYITQGFLGSDSNNFTTTLGREGSDYTAAIFAYCINAESVTIWKDVPGVLNADPRHFEKTQLLNKVPYNEAIELAFYGASVIHPKTLQPLQRKNIKLYVKSFITPEAEGTCVANIEVLEPLVPCFIVKKNQVVISISTRDFSFMVEDNMSEVFKLLHQNRMKVDMLQNSAISFSLCVDNKMGMLDSLLEALQKKFEITCYRDVSLYTVRHAPDEDIKFISLDKKVLLKQRYENTVQIVVEE